MQLLIDSMDILIQCLHNHYGTTPGVMEVLLHQGQLTTRFTLIRIFDFYQKVEPGISSHEIRESIFDHVGGMDSMPQQLYLPLQGVLI